jgi:hypothetical protein
MKEKKVNLPKPLPCGNDITKSKATGKNTSQAPGRPSLDTSRGFSGGKQS